jgi:hypothetical protein
MVAGPQVGNFAGRGTARDTKLSGDGGRARLAAPNGNT